MIIIPTRFYPIVGTFLFDSPLVVLCTGRNIIGDIQMLFIRITNYLDIFWYLWDGSNFRRAKSCNSFNELITENRMRIRRKIVRFFHFFVISNFIFILNIVFTVKMDIIHLPF